ncbi:DUF2955 domain-containing protein [Ramlibacter sp. XY19]|uniref:DUF2955 domain-containing protein n=1 Tax=Ramlibacter paludis TaxID=2908000 RepID=UPI0023D98811|nr:DUF2955 domain-containing protein [Ramlibacter paludis]MCG2595466.1 DUF2955 domain-containing protein [Ramlibacter paludis]
MHPGDKAVLRLAVGLGVAVLVAYGMALRLPFVSCALAVVILCKPGPPLGLAKGLVAGFLVAGMLVAGIVMVPLLEHFPVTGVALTAVVLYGLFFAGARKAGPLTMILVIAFTVIPVAGVLEQALATELAMSLGAGVATGGLVSGLSHALFPDPPRAGALPAPAGADAAGARRIALQATVVIVPVFLLALSNPAFYMAAIMKTVMLGQQASVLKARSAGRELVGSTLLGAVAGALVWGGLTLRPNLWMLMLWVVAAAFWMGRRLFRVKASGQAPSFWLNALVTMFIVLGPGIEDASAGKDVYAASLARVALFMAVTLYAWAVVWLLAPATSSSPVPPSGQRPAHR